MHQEQNMTDCEARERLRYLAACYEAVADSGTSEEVIEAAKVAFDLETLAAEGLLSRP